MNEHDAPESSLATFPLTLLLMRHAKSDWSDGSVSDHDRALNPRGRKDSPRMADWIVQQDLIPDQILCSSAVRTQETVQLITERWKVQKQQHHAETRLCESLYLASPESIFQNACAHGGDAATLLIVAHNPGMSQLASAMANQSLEMPTAAIAVFKVDAESWSMFGSDTALQLTHFIRPKSLD